MLLPYIFLFYTSDKFLALFRDDVEIKFPVADAKPSMPREVIEIEQQIKFLEWKKEMLSSDIQREESLLNTAKGLVKAKSDEYRKLVNEELLSKNY